MISNATTEPDLPQAQRRAAPTPISDAPWIEEAGVPRWRKLAASALVGIAVLIGLAAVTLYIYLVWSNPPDFSHSSSSRELKGLELLYLFLPLVILFGPIWGASWLARRIDPSRTDD